MRHGAGFCRGFMEYPVHVTTLRVDGFGQCVTPGGFEEGHHLPNPCDYVFYHNGSATVVFLERGQLVLHRIEMFLTLSLQSVDALVSKTGILKRRARELGSGRRWTD